MLRRLLMAGAAASTPLGQQAFPVTIPAQSQQLTRFPVYFDLADAPSALWNGLAYADGRDIRVRDAAGAEVPFHLVRLDPKRQQGALFFSASLSSAVPTEVFVHFGDPALPAVASKAGIGANGVWADYHRVFLFNLTTEDYAGSNQPPAVTDRAHLFEKIAENTGMTEHQGVCSDDTHIYVVDTNRINKYDSAWNLVASNLNPVGDVGNGTNHCGDPDVFEGILYVPIESYSSPTVYSNQRIARFRASDLSLIDSVSVAAQGDEVSTCAVDRENDLVCTGRYNSSGTFKVNRYRRSDLAYVDSLTSAAGSAVPFVQGLAFYKGALYANSDGNDFTHKMGPAAETASRVWTDTADGQSNGPGNYEGLGAHRDDLLVLRDSGVSSVVHTIRPINAEAGGGVHLTAGGYLVGQSLNNFNTFTIGATVIAASLSATSRAVVSYTANSTSNNNRVTLGLRGATGKWGVWDTSNTWLESTTDAATTKTRLHARYSGTTSRSLFVNGVKEGNATAITASPSGKLALGIGVEDLSAAELFTGKFGFVYLRPSALSDAWIAAEVANLTTPSSFYTVGAAAPTVSTPGSWTPDALGLSQWLNDDSSVTSAGANACSQWNDRSGNAWHFSQPTANKQPLIVSSGLNGRRIITFDGGDIMLATGTGAPGLFRSAPAGFVFGVYRLEVEDTVPTERTLYWFSRGGGTSSRLALGAGGSTGTPTGAYTGGRRLDVDAFSGASSSTGRSLQWVMVMGVVNYETRQVQLYINGTLEAQNTSAWTSGGSTSDTDSSGVALGGVTSEASYFQGSIAEVFAGVGVPNAAAIDRVFGYAAHRWGLTASLPNGHPYKTVAP